MNKTLVLRVKAQYFNAIKSGTKKEEYRLVTPYWQKRIENKEFSQVVITLGYPPANDTSRTLVFPWNGYEVKPLTHPEFGADPVAVYAIKLNS